MEDPVVEAETTELTGGVPSGQLPLEELGLRARTVSLLRSAGITTAEAAASALEGDGQLAALKGFGPKSLAELKQALAERGLLREAPTVRLSPPPAATVEDTVPTPAVASEAETEVLFQLPVEAAPEEKMPPLRVPPLPGRAPAAATPAPAPRPLAAGPTPVERLQAFFAQGGIRIVAIALGVLGLALIALALFLPPLSLLQRIGGYSRLDAANPVVSHPDGITLRVDEATFDGRLRVKLSSVPRLEFLEGSAGKALRAAAEALPPEWVARSPLYQLKARGKTAQPVMIDVLVPNDSEPWQTLDLYTWDGRGWQWLGSELHTEVAEQEFIRATVTTLPENVLVVQSAATAPAISAYLAPGDAPVSTASGVVHEVNPVGLLLGTLGGFAGDLDGLPQSDVPTVAVIPAVRNWAPGGSVNRGLLADLLASPEMQQAHIANLLQLCAERGFAGVELDYRGVTPDEKAAYTGFVGALAQALHAQNLRLNIVLDPPAMVGGAPDTGGYDWPALGAAADVVKVRFPADPAAYADGGEAERLLDWAKAQIPRSKLRMLVSSLSAEAVGETVTNIPLEQALVPFGQVKALQDVSEVQPGSELEFALESRVLSITPLDGDATYRLEVQAEDGGTRTVWLESAAGLAAKLRWARDYRLGGVAVEHLLHPGNAQRMLDALVSYRDATPAPNTPLTVDWSVDDGSQVLAQESKPLTEPTYRWVVLATPGSYRVSASIAGLDHGAVMVTVVGSVTVSPTAELTSTAAVTPSAGLTATQAVSVCLNASYVADVTIPDNTQMKNGEEFTKTWRVRNSGQCAWPADTVIAFVSGAQMGAPATVEVGALEPGAQKDISVKMKAPDQPGRYTGTWRMKTKDGLFGGNLTVVIQAGEAPASVPAIAPVSGGPFELGGHILNLGYPYASQMHYAGMTWSKVQVRYDPGNNFAGIIQGAHANGFKIQISALGAPDLVTQPGFENTFAAWVASIAAAGADAIEIWNEPNINREWQEGYISPAAYTRLLCASYRAIKAANPNCAVISAAPAPTGWFGGCSANGCDDLPWIAGLRDAGAANCMDYIGAHHNAGATSPSARSGHPADDGNRHHSWYFLPQTELYYNTFGGTRKLFYTEMGYASQEGVPTFSDAFAWARGTNNAQQAQWLAEAVSISARTGMVRCIIVWNVDFVRAGYDPQDGYAIIRPGGACPACDALHAVLGTR